MLLVYPNFCLIIPLTPQWNEKGEIIRKRTRIRRSTLPRDVYWVRHGESEHNRALQEAEAGNLALFEQGRFERINPHIRLTTLGQEQAKAAGAWLMEQVPDLPFDFLYCSDYIRAMETAALLNLPEASWRRSGWLIERNWGEFDHLTPHERLDKHPQYEKSKEQSRWYSTPPGGESFQEMRVRLRMMLQTLARDCPNGRVILVTHSLLMAVARHELEKWSPERFDAWKVSKDPFDNIHNCQIFHYSRVNPHDPSHVESYLAWMRSICPWDTRLSSNEWQLIDRSDYELTNERLLEMVHSHPRLLEE